MTDLQQAFSDFMSKLLPEHGRIGTVVSVDKDKHLCDVYIEIDDITLYKVKLSADGTNNGIVLIPKVNSFVVVNTMHKDDNQNYLAMVGDVEEIVMRTGSMGGLAIVQKIADSLNTIEKDLNSLKNLFTTWTPVPNDGGAALKAASTSWSANTLELTAKNDIENSNIKHG